MVTARIAGFKPGTSPPPVNIAILPLRFSFFAIVFDLILVGKEPVKYEKKR
jgi:hypothetical protein